MSRLRHQPLLQLHNTAPPQAHRPETYRMDIAPSKVDAKADRLATALHADAGRHRSAVADQFVRVGDEAKSLQAIYDKLMALEKSSRGSPRLTELADALKRHNAQFEKLSNYVRAHLPGDDKERGQIVQEIQHIKSMLQTATDADAKAIKTMQETLDAVLQELHSHAQAIAAISQLNTNKEDEDDSEADMYSDDDEESADYEPYTRASKLPSSFKYQPQETEDEEADYGAYYRLAFTDLLTPTNK